MGKTGDTGHTGDSRDREKWLYVAEDGNAGGANKLVAGDLGNGENGEFGRLRVSGDWEIRRFVEFGKLVRFGKIRKTLNEERTS